MLHGCAVYVPVPDENDKRQVLRTVVADPYLAGWGADHCMMSRAGDRGAYNAPGWRPAGPPIALQPAWLARGLALCRGGAPAFITVSPPQFEGSMAFVTAERYGPADTGRLHYDLARERDGWRIMLRREAAP